MAQIQRYTLTIGDDGVNLVKCERTSISIKRKIKSCSSIHESDLIIQILGYNWGKKKAIGLDALQKIIKGVERNPPAITIHYNLKEYENQNTYRLVNDLYKYCSSSIWNYFYDGNPDNLKKIINEICANLRLNRYYLAAAWEYQMFNYRKRKQSFLDDIGGHGTEMLPFLFHSEEEIWNTFLKPRPDSGGVSPQSEEEIWNNFLKTRPYIKYSWRILLVDDHANDGLSYAPDTNQDKSIGKLEIIKDNLCRKEYGVYKDECEIESEMNKHRSNILFECAINKKDALDKLKSGNRYDLILLDFKLKNTIFNPSIEPSELGTDILGEIKKATQKYLPSPAGEYNFLFISAYPTAVQEMMMAKGLYSHTDYWFVRRGACPINTPWMFMYELNQMMERRIRMLSKHQEMVTNNDKFKDVENKLQSPTAIAFFKWLYVCKKENEYQNVRDRCKNAFNAFLSLRSTYDKIKYDVYDGKEHLNKEGEQDKRFVSEEKQESHLIRSMFPDVGCYCNLFWEHMQHLIYLTAYGTNRQWPEMWEELRSVSSYLNDAENRIKEGDTENKSDIDEVPTVKLIRNYILNLKYQNSR